MDDPNRHRRQTDPLGVSSSRFASQPSRSIPPGSAERYRTGPISSTSPQTPRTLGSTGNYNSNNYYNEPTSAFSSSNMPAAGMPGYGPDYTQDGRQSSQGFAGYNTAAMVYNVAQPTAQTAAYDAHQFESRQPAAMQLMTPDVTSAYFGAAANASGQAMQHTAAAAATVGASGSPSSVYQQQNPSLGYGSNMAGVLSSTMQTASADVSMNEDQEYSDVALEEKWHSYQRQLASIFDQIAAGSLENASKTLLEISGWLLSQVSDLGLTIDDASLHADRIKLWDDFNHAWLALGQKQLDMMHANQQAASQRLLSRDTIEKLGNEIVHLCDGLERHGLVDYQYGVWEDQIIAVFEDCLDLLESMTQE